MGFEIDKQLARSVKRHMRRLAREAAAAGRQPGELDSHSAEHPPLSAKQIAAAEERCAAGRTP